MDWKSFTLGLLLFLLLFTSWTHALYPINLTTLGTGSALYGGVIYTGRDTWVNGVQNSSLNNFTQVNYGKDQNFSVGGSTNSSGLPIFSHNGLLAFNMSYYCGLKFNSIDLFLYQMSNSSEGRVGQRNGTNVSVTWINTVDNWTELQATWYNNTASTYWTVPGGSPAIAAVSGCNSSLVNSTGRWYQWNCSANVSWWEGQACNINGNLTSLTSRQVYTTALINETIYKWFVSKENRTVGAQIPYITFVIDEAPRIVVLGANNTTPNPAAQVMLNGTLTDDVELSGFIFSADNCTGTFGNWTWQAFTVNNTNATTNVIIPNSCEGKPFQYTYYVNDSRNQWNTTTPASILVQNVAPTIGAAAVNTTITANGTTICLNATNVVDIGVGLDKVWAQIIFPNTTVVTHYYLDNTSSKGTCGGGGSTYSAFLNVGAKISPPELQIPLVSANDTLNNIGTHAPKIMVTIVDPHPRFYNVNATPPSPACDAGLIINFSINWTSFYGLNNSILQWNSLNTSMDLFAGTNKSGWWYHLLTGLVPGIYSWNITGCDAFGNCNTTPTAPYNVTNSTPPCSAIANGNGSIFTSGFSNDLESRRIYIPTSPYALVGVIALVGTSLFILLTARKRKKKQEEAKNA